MLYHATVFPDRTFSERLSETGGALLGVEWTHLLASLLDLGQDVVVGDGTLHGHQLRFQVDIVLRHACLSIRHSEQCICMPRTIDFGLLEHSSDSTRASSAGHLADSVDELWRTVMLCVSLPSRRIHKYVPSNTVLIDPQILGKARAPTAPMFDTVPRYW